MQQKNPASIILALTGAQLLFYLYSGYLSGEPRYGFNQLRHWEPLTIVGILLVLGGLLTLAKRLRWKLPGTEPVSTARAVIYACMVALGSFPLFLLFRNGFVNDDGLAWSFNLLAGINYVGLDEMLTMLTVNSLWKALGDPVGFTPFHVYACFSAVMGFAFMFFTVLLACRDTGKSWPLLVLLVVSGGFMQAFFGDVENYAGVMALCMAYIWAAREFLEERVSILIPGLLLVLAMCMHLLALCLFPAHLLLCRTAWKRGSRWLVPASAALMVIVFLLVMLIAADAGLDLRNLHNSHIFGSGTDVSTVHMFAAPSVTYYNAVTSVLFLLFPFWWVPVLLALTGNMRNDAFNRFLVAASTGFLALAYVWRLNLRPYFDWNLVACSAIPASVLAWRNLLLMRREKLLSTAMVFLAATGGLHSYSWILANHGVTSMPRMDVMRDIMASRRGDGNVIPDELRAYLSNPCPRDESRRNSEDGVDERSQSRPLGGHEYKTQQEKDKDYRGKPVLPAGHDEAPDISQFSHRQTFPEGFNRVCRALSRARRFRP